MSRIDLIGDESGMTLVELLVATAAGVVVMFGVTMAMIVTMRETNRISSHVDANQRARLTMTKIMAELHSACVAPQIAPVREGSSGTILVFWHQSGSAVAPIPVKSEISLTGTTLTQADYPVNGGAAPEWTFSTTPSSTLTLMTGVNPVSATTPVFRYYAFSNGVVSATPLTVPLSKTEAAKAVLVSVAFENSPMKTAIANDANAATEIQDSALLRLTAPGYVATASNLPCQ